MYFAKKIILKNIQAKRVINNLETWNAKKLLLFEFLIKKINCPKSYPDTQNEDHKNQLILDALIQGNIPKIKQNPNPTPEPI